MFKVARKVSNPFYILSRGLEQPSHEPKFQPQCKTIPRNGSRMTQRPLSGRVNRSSIPLMRLPTRFLPLTVRSDRRCNVSQENIDVLKQPRANPSSYTGVNTPWNMISRSKTIDEFWETLRRRKNVGRLLGTSQLLGKGKRASFRCRCFNPSGDHTPGTTVLIHVQGDWPSWQNLMRAKRGRTEYRGTLMMIASPHVRTHGCLSVDGARGGGGWSFIPPGNRAAVFKCSGSPS